MTILTLFVLGQTTIMLDPKVLQGGIIILIKTYTTYSSSFCVFIMVPISIMSIFLYSIWLFSIYSLELYQIILVFTISFKYVKINCFRLLLSLPLEERMQKLLSEVCLIILAVQNSIILIIRL